MEVTYRKNKITSKSYLPKYTRRDVNASLFGERINHDVPLNSRRKDKSRLNSQLSKSLTNITPRALVHKPPPSPAPAFQKLSPIIGSSPEPAPELATPVKSKSSPSKIPRSRSTPPSRKQSPATSRVVSPKGSTSNSRAGSKVNSRNPSRSTSPSKPVTSTVKGSSRNFRNVQPKVNTFNKITKPQVPPKPHDIPNQSSQNSSDSSKDRNKFKSASTKTANILRATAGSRKTLNRNIKNPIQTQNKSNASKFKHKNLDEIRRVDSLDSSDTGTERSNKNPEIFSSANTVVSSTTTTATQPLKIETKLEDQKAEQNETKVTHMYMDEGRVLSATSVSSAINRMNDTVLDTRTVISDRGFSKLSPAANAIISMAKEDGTVTENLTNAKISNDFEQKSVVEEKKIGEVNEKNIESEQVTKTDNDEKRLENNAKTGTNFTSETAKQINNNGLEKQNNLNHNTNSREFVIGLRDNNSVNKSANERLKEARTIVAADVKQLKINVKEKPTEILVQSGNVREKPMELLVQSGNIRYPVNSTNGVMNT